MAEGNVWTFRAVWIRSVPDSAPDTSVMDGAMTQICTGLVTLTGGVRAWAMAFGPYDIYTAYYREAGNAVLVYNDTSDAEPDTLLALPLEVGKTWTCGGYTMVVREQATVEVPVGTYKDCWRVETNDNGVITSFWYAPNVGLVLEEITAVGEDFTLDVRYELTYASVK